MCTVFYYLSKKGEDFHWEQSSGRLTKKLLILMTCVGVRGGNQLGPGQGKRETFYCVCFYTC